MGRIPFTILLVILTASALFAQRKQKVVDLQDYRYKKQASGGLRIQTNGISLYAQYGWIKDIYRTRLIQIEYNYYIDYRQKKQKAQTEGARGYLYGFQNKLHTIHLSYGLERVIADKAARNGVRLSFVFFGGFSLGLLKPYYLELNQPGDTNTLPTHKPERYSEGNADRFLDKNQIYGAAPIRYGLSQIQPVPGIHTKSALNFDWGVKDEFVKALEAGVMLDLYYKRLPIMVNNHNRFYQIALYLSFHFGKRW
jgi:hypothetical protein